MQELLQSQPQTRLDDALGEVFKIAIINAPTVMKKLSDNKSIDLYKLLPQLIQSKLKIVQTDPFEKKGNRRLLNLGHTLGHVLESHFSIGHGHAVKLGILFAARWSFHLDYLKEKDFVQIWNLIHKSGPIDLQEKLKNISKNTAKKLLAKDKKLITSSQVDFIFIKKIGKVFRNKMSLQSIIDEMQRQKMEF